MKKVLKNLIVVCIIIIIGVCFLGKTSYADTVKDNPRFYVEGGEVEAGGIVSVPLYFDSLSGICSASINVLYYQDLEFVSFEESEGKVENITAFNKKEPGKAGEISVSFMNNDDLKGAKLIGTIKFKVPDNAEPLTTYDVMIGKVDKILSSKNGEILTYNDGDTIVSIKENEEINDITGNSIMKRIIIFSGIGISVIIAVIILVIFIAKKKK